MYFALLEVAFLFKFFSLLLKSVFFKKLAVSLLFAKFACDNLAVIYLGANLLNSWVVIYLLWSCILFLTAVRAVVVGKLIILGILFLMSFIL